MINFKEMENSDYQKESTEETLKREKCRAREFLNSRTALYMMGNIRIIESTDTENI